MKKKSKLPRYPKVLFEKLRFALFCVRDLDHEMVMDLLMKYRCNRTRFIAATGINNKYLPTEVGNCESVSVKDLEPIPIEHLHNIEQLDEAFQQLHKYRNGGAGDYIAADVESGINSLRAKMPRAPRIGRGEKVDHDEICAYLRRRSYESSSNKKALRIDAMSHFNISERTIYTALSKGRIPKK